MSRTMKQWSKFVDKYNYKTPTKCPICGGRLKENGEISFRCRKCDFEFMICIRYDTKTDNSFYLDNNFQIQYERSK